MCDRSSCDGPLGLANPTGLLLYHQEPRGPAPNYSHEPLSDRSIQRHTDPADAGVTVVTLQDSSVLDMAIIDQIGKDLCHLVENQNKQKLVLDFINVRFLASHALGILLMMHKKICAAKGTMVAMS